MTSLFSVVQGRRALLGLPPAPEGSIPPSGPPPVDPSGAPPMGAPMPASPPLPGYADGTLGFSWEDNPADRGGNEHGDGSGADASTARYLDDGAYNIPGYETPTWAEQQNAGAGSGNLTSAPSFDQPDSAGPGYTSSANHGDIMALQAEYYKNYGQVPTDEDAAQILAGMDARRDEERAYSAAHARDAAGPDHFYENRSDQLAAEARQREDAYKIADAAQQFNQQKLGADWHQAQATAGNQRAQNITSAGGQAQSSFLAALKYAVPGQDLNFAPGLLSEEARNPDSYAPPNSLNDQNAPNMPGYVFNKPEGAK